MGITVPPDVYKLVKGYVRCPDPIWEAIAYLESDFNPGVVGDGPNYGGYSYGLFQLHVANDGQGQGNQALALIQARFGLSGQAAISYLLTHADIQSEIGMPPINTAWDNLRNTYDPSDTNWWLQFCAQSGHPGGSSTNSTTIAYVNNLMAKVVRPNLFGIQQVGAGQGANNNSAPDNTWLAVLINNPPNQPCSVIWRRTCPGAKAALEGGMDLVSPNGTEVFALGDGVVVGAGYFWHADNSPGHGVVTIRTTMPDGTQQDIYYQHIQLADNIILCEQTGGQLYNNIIGPPATFQKIKKGTLLGTVVMGEVEVGANANWAGIWGSHHPAPWADDPEPIIRELMDQGGGSNATTLSFNTGNAFFDDRLSVAFTNTATGLDLVTKNPGLIGPIFAFNEAQQFKPFAIPDNSSAGANWPIWGGVSDSITMPTRLMMGIIQFTINNAIPFIIRSFFAMIAIVIIMALIINVLSKVVEKTAHEVGQVAPLIGAVAAL